MVLAMKAPSIGQIRSCSLELGAHQKGLLGQKCWLSFYGIPWTCRLSLTLVYTPYRRKLGHPKSCIIAANVLHTKHNSMLIVHKADMLTVIVHKQQDLFNLAGEY